MALDLNALTAYVDQTKVDLIKKMILAGRSMQFLTVQPGIKSGDALNLLSSNLVASAGGCGFQDLGDTILSQNTLNVCPLRVQESICVQELEKYWTQVMLAPGSYDTDFGFEQIYTEEKVAQVSSLMDTLIWQGNKDSVNPQLALCDGFIHLAQTTFSGDVVNGNVNSVTAITPANIIDIVDNAIEVIPTNIIAQDDLFLYCGYDFARTYFTALRNSNLYNYPSVETGSNDFMITIPSANVKLVALKGLTGTNKFFISTKSNLFVGVDLINDYEDIQIWFSMDFQEVRTNIRWKQGAQAAFWDYVVFFEL